MLRANALKRRKASGVRFGISIPLPVNIHCRVEDYDRLHPPRAAYIRRHPKQRGERCGRLTQCRRCFRGFRVISVRSPGHSLELHGIEQAQVRQLLHERYERPGLRRDIRQSPAQNSVDILWVKINCVRLDDDISARLIRIQSRGQMLHAVKHRVPRSADVVGVLLAVKERVQYRPGVFILRDVEALHVR